MDSEDEILREIGLASDDEAPKSSKSNEKAGINAGRSDASTKKKAKPKKARRSHSKAMDDFIVSDNESDDSEAPRKKKRTVPVENTKPDFDMPDVTAILSNIFGESDEEKLGEFGEDVKEFEDLSDVDEGLVPRAKVQLKKWTTYYRKLMSAEKRNARGRRGEDDDGVNEAAILPEGTKRRRRTVDDDDDDDMSNALPGERAKKPDPNKMSDEEILVKATEFVERMEQACHEDNESNRQRKPALKKLAMLEEAKQILLRIEWHDALLNAGVLITCTKWLQPLPDRTLPNVTIREGILRALSSFVEVSKHMLKESKIGAVVMFLSKNDPEPSLRKAAADLVQQWSRTLSSGSDSWQSQSESERHRTQEARLSQRAQRVLSTQFAYGRRVQGTEDAAQRKAKGPQFASQPIVSTMDYVVRPQSKIDVQHLVKKSGGVRIFAKQQR